LNRSRRRERREEAYARFNETSKGYGISQHLTVEATEPPAFGLSSKLLAAAYAQQAELVQRQQKWRDRMLFTAAAPVEPLNTRIDLPVPPAVHTVIATDGPKLPNHHEIAYCYLLNVGR